MNTPVSFELAKLLKEKEFDKHGYLQDVWLGHKYEWMGKGKNKRSVEIPVFGLGSTSVLPTIAEVVMWLYEKHGIWIYAERYSTLFRCYAEEIGDERFGKWEGHKYESPTEAYEAAIEYTLTKLI